MLNPDNLEDQLCY